MLPRLAPTSRLTALQGTAAWGILEAADPAMPPGTRPIWLPSSRTTQPRPPLVPHIAKEQKTRGQEIWPQYLSCHSLGETLD